MLPDKLFDTHAQGPRVPRSNSLGAGQLRPSPSLMKYLAAILALAVSTSVVAQAGFWNDSSGRPVADSESRKSKNGFAGWLLATPDEDWQAKWETPSGTVPIFNEAKQVHRGKRIFVLIFFANPKLDSEGAADLSCDLRVTRPDRSTSIDQKGVVCFKGRILGTPHHLYLSAPVIAFVGEPADPSGEWIVEVKLRDNARNMEAAAPHFLRASVMSETANRSFDADTYGQGALQAVRGSTRLAAPCRCVPDNSNVEPHRGNVWEH